MRGEASAVHDSLVRGRSSVFGAMLWMLGLSFLGTLVLGWIPVVGPYLGPLLGGYVGGRRAGGPGRAILAAILPALILFGLIVALGAAAGGWVGVPVLGAAAAVFAGAATFIALMHNGALFLAALVGGLLAQSEY